MDPVWQKLRIATLSDSVLSELQHNLGYSQKWASSDTQTRQEGADVKYASHETFLQDQFFTNQVNCSKHASRPSIHRVNTTLKA